MIEDLDEILDRLGSEVDPSVAIDRELFAREGGYYHFFKAAWHTVESVEPEDEAYVEFMCRHMEALMRGQLDSGRLLINIPPGHSKSLICVVFSLAWLWTIDPRRSRSTRTRTKRSRATWRARPEW